MTTLGTKKGALVTERWLDHARSRPDEEAIVVWKAGEPAFRWTFGTLIQAAFARATQLRNHGVRPGETCSMLLRHAPGFYPTYLGIALLGAIPSVLAPPNARLHPEKFRSGLEGMANKSGIDWILSESDLVGVVEPLVRREGSGIRGILTPLEWSLPRETEKEIPIELQRPPQSIQSDSPLLLQHSSGTTGLQKAVVLSHRAVGMHLDRYARAIELRDSDKVVSWLPLYHDMGLIAAFHLPLAHGIASVQLDPFDWIMDPVQLLSALSSEAGTLAWLPNFAFNLMADKIHEDDLEGLRLGGIRTLINCSEPVSAESHSRFVRRFSPYGFSAEKISACYAMAETTFAVTQTTPGKKAKSIVADRAALSQGRVRHAALGADVRECVSSGAPIEGCEVRVLDRDGRCLEEDQVGELSIGSVSMFDGYRNSPEKTADVLANGWYRSGDLGFRHDGEFYVVGRKKDLIIVAGKNIYPEDVEAGINAIEGVIPGRAIAFGLLDDVLGTEKVCVVVETKLDDSPARQRLIGRIREAGMQMDVTISAVHLKPPRWLIKSSSGKPSRSENMRRLIDEGPS